ncbi:hypothetical protein H9L10_03620 [Phycicoccus endophyticus]|uniref:Uncharacterized protein n=1 Tax=Phycicoccus endophyticus TaxID=1690220 RepID=A0A7G9R3I3_9MICO|nr:hypothetical protein [Phycicoccus endophyticus]NHI19914.1 hypothetical protein [Phycicoccus endophyticus]QNN50158.1 hypothetical protein H9L10_03620 [Phycicoccus endophyticus]GGL27571.1 hypothetical protein GCM10012283_07190 [Phycicoccus endophyticus]
MSRRRPARATTAPIDVSQVAPATAGDEPCPGPCNHTFRRAENAALEETARAHSAHAAHGDGPCTPDCVPDRALTEHDTPFHPGRPVWCVDVPAFNDRGELLDRLAHRGCTSSILTKLRDLPDLASALTPGALNTPRDADIDHGSTSHGGARSLAHAPSPSPGWDTADEIIRWALHLEDYLRHRLEDPAPPHPYRTLAEAVAYLHRHGTALLATPDAARIGRDILDTHRRLERLVGQDRLTHRIPEPCPRCKRKGLRRRDGSELVRCIYCPAVWDWEHLPHLARVYADSIRPRGGDAS